MHYTPKQLKALAKEYPEDGILPKDEAELIAKMLSEDARENNNSHDPYHKNQHKNK